MLKLTLNKVGYKLLVPFPDAHLVGVDMFLMVSVNGLGNILSFIWLEGLLEVAEILLVSFLLDNGVLEVFKGRALVLQLPNLL